MFKKGERVVWKKHPTRHLVFEDYSHKPYTDKAFVWQYCGRTRTIHLMETCDLVAHEGEKVRS